MPAAPASSPSASEPQADSQAGVGLHIPDTLPNRPTRLLLVSHAESMQRRYGNLSLSDTGLTALGWEQSNALSEWLRTHEQIQTLVSNPQMRCRLTAQRISQALGLPVLVESRFPPSPQRNWMLLFPLEGADEQADYASYEAKVITAFDHLLADHWGETILVVTNPNAIVTFLRYVGGPGQVALTIDDTGITEVTLNDHRWQINYINRREHLPRPALSTPSNRPEPAVDSDVREQLTQIRQIYNQLASAVQLDEMAGQMRKVEEDNRELLRFVGGVEGQRLLEVGSGLGQVALLMAKAGAAEVAGVDISPAMLERAEYLRLSLGDPELLRRVSYRLGAAQDLPFAGNSFDLVLCRFLLHHIAKLERTLAEFYRVLRPEGVLVVAELAGSEDAVKRATQNVIETKRNPSHATIRTVESLRDQLATAGFIVEKEKVIKREREVGGWLDELAVEKSIRQAVIEMLEASIETDAAELGVHKRNDALFFEQKVVYLQARKNAPAG